MGNEDKIFSDEFGDSENRKKMMGVSEKFPEAKTTKSDKIDVSDKVTKGLEKGNKKLLGILGIVVISAIVVGAYYGITEGLIGNSEPFDVTQCHYGDHSDIFGLRCITEEEYTKDFLGKEKDSLKKAVLEKGFFFNGYIDNFYIFTGDDIYYDTTMDYFGNVSMEFYEEGINATGTAYVQPKDFAKEVDKIWSTFGLRSTASKILFGLILLCIIGIGLVGMFIATHNPVNFPTVTFIVIIFMVLFVYLKLLPVWIPIVLGIIAVGIIVWLVKTHFTSGGG